jgi:tripartite-type tricarboxylate transporter receptor subunit TctC
MAVDRVLPRIVSIVLSTLLLALLFTSNALAEYPGKIIKIVVPFAAGGGTDVIARTLAQEMAKELGAAVIIENKPGAGTISGTQAVATSEPDRLNKSAGFAVKSQSFEKLAANEGLVMVARPPEELERYVRGEEERWRKVIREVGIKME